MKTQRNRLDQRGFTLVEVLLVVTIVGILAAVVIPSFANATVETQQKAFAACLKTFYAAAMYYEAKTGEYPADSSSGNCPAGWEDYIDKDIWTRPTPVGGVWDTEFEDSGVTSAVGVHFGGSHNNNPGDAYMSEVDELIDNGDLNTGSFRKIAGDRYYIIVAP